MSVNLYFREGVRKHAGFKSELYGDQSDQVTFKGLKVYREVGDGGRLYAVFNLDIPIPNDLMEFVEEISCHEYILRMATREHGVYQHKSASCELIAETYARRPAYKLKIVAKNLEDIRELVHMIKVGTIRPNESYEGPQGGKSRAELEKELAAALEQARLAEKDLTTYRLRLRQYVEELKEATFDRPWWTLCVRSKVVERLNDILLSNT